MVEINSLVLGAVSQSPSTKRLLKLVSAQEFIKDEVLIAPSLDPRFRIAHANKVLRSGKSLVLDATERTMRSLQR